MAATLSTIYQIDGNSNRRRKDRENYSMPNAALTDSDQFPPLAPLQCEKCNIQTPNLRYFCFSETKSFLFFTRRTQNSGIFCQNCADKVAYKSTFITSLLGWWGFPWGFIYTPAALITNLMGGKRPAVENTNLMVHQARAYASRGEHKIAQLCLSNAALFASETTEPFRRSAQGDITEMQRSLAPGGIFSASKALARPEGAFFIQSLIISLTSISIFIALSTVHPQKKPPKTTVRK